MAPNRQNIWSYEQNKPSLVVMDICQQYPEIDPNFIYQVLLQRGVFKWLAVRRDIIKLKDKWKYIFACQNSHQKHTRTFQYR